MPDAGRRFQAAAGLLCALLFEACVAGLHLLATAIAGGVSVVQGLSAMNAGRTEGAIQIGVGVGCSLGTLLPNAIGFLGALLLLRVATAALRGHGTPGQAWTRLAVTFGSFLAAEIVTCQVILVPATLVLGGACAAAISYGRLNEP